LAVAALDEEHRALHALDGRNRAVMQPGVADGLADDDPIAGPVRRRPVERLEDHFGSVQPPELVLGFPGQGVQLDALGVGGRLDATLDRIAIRPGASYVRSRTATPRHFRQPNNFAVYAPFYSAANTRPRSG